MLLKWRNDPDTRENSANQGEIEPNAHAKWLETVLTSNRNLLLIAEIDGKPIGAFRIDKLTMYEEQVDVPDCRLISYVVAPSHRRKGYGTAIVREATISYGGDIALIAKIRSANTASRKILEANDFVVMGDIDEGIVAYIRMPTHEPKVQ